MITIYPRECFEEVVKDWKEDQKLSDLTGGPVIGAIESISKDDLDYPFITFYSGAKLNDECALMLSMGKKFPEASLAYFWDAGFQVGCIAYTHETFIEFTILEENLYEYTKEVLIEAGEYDEETEEEDITERRVDCRDQLQLSFLEYIASQSPDNYQLYELVPSELSVVPGFTLESGFELEFEITILESLAADLEIYLKPLDYDDLSSVGELYQQGDSEYWKSHRERVRGLLKEMPEEYRDNVDLFKAIIPKVAAWALEYAGENVRSDKSVIEMAVQSDKDNNYGVSALTYASDNLLHDLDFIKSILVTQPLELRNFISRYKEDPSRFTSDYVEKVVEGMGENALKEITRQ